MKNNEIYAALDLGSNSFRLLIAELGETGIIPLVKELKTVRLAENMSKRHAMGQEAMERGWAALRSFATQIHCYSPKKILACGTAVLRQASNSQQFNSRAAHIIGSPVKVLTGNEEAAYSMNGVLAALPSLPSPPLMVLDVGGGSSEIMVPDVHYTQEWPWRFLEPAASTSLAIGAVATTEQCPVSGKVTKELEALDSSIQPIIRAGLKQLLRTTALPRSQQHKSAKPWRLIASGGTATALAALDLGLSRYNEELVQGHTVSMDGINRLLDRLGSMPPERRNQEPGLDHGRGEIIVAGIMIHKIFMEICSTDHLTVSDAGLLEGILLRTPAV